MEGADGRLTGRVPITYSRGEVRFELELAWSAAPLCFPPALAPGRKVRLRGGALFPHLGRTLSRKWLPEGKLEFMGGPESCSASCNQSGVTQEQHRQCCNEQDAANCYFICHESLGVKKQRKESAAKGT